MNFQSFADKIIKKETINENFPNCRTAALYRKLKHHFIVAENTFQQSYSFRKKAKSILGRTFPGYSIGNIFNEDARFYIVWCGTIPAAINQKAEDNECDIRFRRPTYPEFISWMLWQEYITALDDDGEIPYSWEPTNEYHRAMAGPSTTEPFIKRVYTCPSRFKAFKTKISGLLNDFLG